MNYQNQYTEVVNQLNYLYDGEGIAPIKLLKPLKLMHQKRSCQMLLACHLTGTSHFNRKSVKEYTAFLRKKGWAIRKKCLSDKAERELHSYNPQSYYLLGDGNSTHHPTEQKP